jgi:peptidoglycan/xylan/chitin deacetylase (PgdA/CDA1 family)
MQKKLCLFVWALTLLATLGLGARPVRAGMVSLVFDDGLSSVYQYAFPVLARYGLPATVGIISSRVRSGDPDFMTRAQLQALEKAGWEIASHGLTHKRPVDIPRYLSDEECLRLRPAAGHEGLYEGKYRFAQLAGLVENGRLLRERASSRLVAEEPGTYYYDELIEEVLVHPYAPGSVARHHIRAISYEREMTASRQELADMGFAVKTYVTPHNYWTTEMHDLSRRIYAQVVSGGDDCNRKGSTDRYWLKRFLIHSDDSAASIIELVRLHAVAENGWVIFCLHGVGSDLGWEPWSQERLAALCAYLKNQAIPVVTIDEGVRRWVEERGKPGV